MVEHRLQAFWHLFAQVVSLAWVSHNIVQMPFIVTRWSIVEDDFVVPLK